ncbi:MAG TPA: hypothetical protein VJY33_07935 [Isosphaeraceae bacterium]|nr:hypothetical protein [Isosphaeraceae bacterium]
MGANGAVLERFPRFFTKDTAMPNTLNPMASGARPSFFRCLCREAAQGGTKSYAEAGYDLVRHVGELDPLGMEDDDWAKELEELSALVLPLDPDRRLRCSDDNAVLAWFDRWLPPCMALVPRSRRQSFLKGVYSFVDDDRNEIIH